MRRMTRTSRALGLAALLGATAFTFSARPADARSFVQVGLAAPALFAPPPELVTAYDTAMAHFNNLELDAALQALDGAISQAQAAGMSNDPALAPLLILRAGIIYSNTGDPAQTLVALDAAVRADYFIAIPIELRSEELQQLLDQARSQVGAPPAGEAIAHVPPEGVAGQDLEIQAHMQVTMMEGFQAALYWRKAGEADFRTVAMETFGNLAWASIPASEHGDGDIEYAIYAFDANQAPIANKGDTENPLKVSFGAAKDAGGEEGKGEEGKGDDSGAKKDKKKRKKGGPGGLPRFFINLGLGTGAGVANGAAELTYRQYLPADAGFQYSPREQACAIARWYGGDTNKGGRVVSSLPSQLEFQTQALPDIMAQAPDALAGLDTATLAANYDPSYCSERHPVSTGMALAPFHIAPEFGFRVSERIVVSVYGRLQVVTGSRVFRGDDPEQKVPLAEHVAQTLKNPLASGERDKPPFTWALGAKLKYFMRPPEKKLRLYVGGFAGGGFARLMVNMGFSDDRNGNSVPDAREAPLDQIVDPNTGTTTCVPVWPYNQGCDQGSNDYNLALATAANADTTNRRDTVVLGAGFVGALFGLHAQLHKNFALFAEINAGVWFPKASSFLLDINVGPAITF